MKKFLLILFSVTLFSCSQKSGESNSSVLSKEKIVDLQVDLYLVEAANNMKVLKQDSLDTEYSALFETVLKKHDVTKEDYERSLRYYAIDNKSLDEIYDSVLVKLTQLENTIAYPPGE